MDQNGALYGSTTRRHVIYRLAPPVGGAGSWTMSVLVDSITSGLFFYDLSALTLSPNGSVYGVAYVNGRGFSVIEVVPPATPGALWTASLLPVAPNGGGPGWELVSDENGVLYGSDMGRQEVYKMTPPAISGGDWVFTTLYTLNGSDGADPFGRLLIGPSGQLFGATLNGGTGDRCHNYPPYKAGCGTLFELQ